MTHDRVPPTIDKLEEMQTLAERLTAELKKCREERDVSISQWTSELNFLRHGKDTLAKELESTSDKLSDCWLFLDELARNRDRTIHGIGSIPEKAEKILRKQMAPGWKVAAVRKSNDQEMDINAEVAPGVCISTAARMVQDVSDRFGVTVHLDFNGTHCQCVPGGSASEVAEKYHRDHNKRMSNVQ